MWNISRWFIRCNTISVFWLQKGSYNRIWWKSSWSAYLTLKNDFHTPCNTISSMVNVCIRYVIFWTKVESFHNVKYLQLDSLHAMRYLSAGYKKGWGGGGGCKSLYDKVTPGVLISCCTMAHTHSYGELFYYIMKELRPGVLISRWK